MPIHRPAGATIASRGLVNGQPADYDVSGTSCTTPNPAFQPLDYNVPSSMSGIADLPGGNALVTLGLWDKVLGTGTPFLQASTTFHELGHNLELSHGGKPAVIGSKALGTATYFEPNCKPNDLSSMSYLFQAHGLIDVNGDQHFDYSATIHNNISESALVDGDLNPTPSYRPTWFAAGDSALATLLGVTPASRMCNGIKFGDMATPPATQMARVWAPGPSVSNDWNVPIDWFGDDGTVADLSSGSANVNFDGAFGGTDVLSTTLYGFDDWTNIRLNQNGAGRRLAQFSSSAVGDVAADGGDVAADGGDVAADGGDVAADGGDVAADGGDVAADGGDVAADGGDVAADGGDVAADGGVGAELDFETAKALGRTPPASFRACVLGGTAAQNGCSGPWLDNDGNAHSTQPAPGDAMYHRVYTTWKPPSVGSVAHYAVSRVPGAKVTTLSTAVSVGTTEATTLVDTTELPDGVQFTYFVKAVFSDDAQNPFSGASNFVTITAVDDAPVAVADAYNATSGTTLTVSAALGVLANDTDDDSPKTSLNAVIVTAPSHGSVVLNADGSFSYTPAAGFSGADTFTYKANDGTFAIFGTNQTVPRSSDSAPATVTINVTTSNVAPSCKDDAATVVTGESKTINVIANDCSDPDVGQTLTITAVTQGAHGSVTFTATSVTYTATSPYVGSDSFTYTVSDGNGGTITGKVTMSVIYGFENVQNLPPPAGKTFSRGGTVALKWQWTNATGTSLDSSAASPEVLAKSNKTGQKDPNTRNSDGTIGAEIVIK